MSKTPVLLCCVLAAAGVARSAEPGPLPTPIAPPARIPYPESMPAGPAGTAISTNAIPRAVRRAVVADAAQRFRVAQSAVVLTRAEQVTWPDASIGCPEPNRAYLQALVPGFRVVASTTAGEMLYHTDTRGNVMNCGVMAATQRR